MTARVQQLKSVAVSPPVKHRVTILGRWAKWFIRKRIKLTI